MSKLSEVFGVEEYEVFQLVDNMGYYRFTSTSLEFRASDISPWNESSITLNALLQKEIKRLPFIPQRDEHFYTYFRVDDKWIILREVWVGTVADYARLKAGMVFRSEDEAGRKLKDIYKEMTGKEYVYE